MPVRYDFSKLDKLEKLPNGSIRVPTNLTRTGVLVYKRADGTPLREYRSPEEVFDETSMRTLRGATVIDGHPAMVSPKNWKQHALGHVADDVKPQDGKFLRSDLVISAENGIKKIARGDRLEVSCGYQCELEFTPGITPEGEHYDAIQKQIRYNHVGLVPPNGGRAGRQVAMLLDSLDEQFSFDSEEDSNKVDQIMPVKLRLDDGREVEEGSAQHIAHLDSLVSAATARLDAATKAAKDLEDKLKKAEDPTRIDSLVLERLSVYDGARVILGDEASLKGVSTLDLIKKSILKMDAKAVLDGKSEDYLRGKFEAFVESKKETKSRTDSSPSAAAVISIPVVAPTQQAAKTTQQQNQMLADKSFFHSRENLLGAK